MLPVPLRRDRFTTEVGPDDSGSKPGIEGCIHLPEISGMDAVLSLPLLAAPTVGATDCPKTGAAVAAASVATKRKSRCTFMTTSRLPLRSSSFPGAGHFIRKNVQLTCGDHEGRFATTRRGVRCTDAISSERAQRDLQPPRFLPLAAGGQRKTS